MNNINYLNLSYLWYFSFADIVIMHIQHLLVISK
jgi:hypothetical protein